MMLQMQNLQNTCPEQKISLFNCEQRDTLAGDILTLDLHVPFLLNVETVSLK